MNKNYQEAFVEVLEVIENCNEKIKEKIPDRFITYLKQNADKEYKPQIDFTNGSWQNTIKQETQDILALVYRDYVVSIEKRKELILQEKEKLIQKEKQLREKYNPDKIFRKSKK